MIIDTVERSNEVIIRDKRCSAAAGVATTAANVQMRHPGKIFFSCFHAINDSRVHCCPLSSASVCRRCAALVTFIVCFVAAASSRQNRFSFALETSGNIQTFGVFSTRINPTAAASLFRFKLCLLGKFTVQTCPAYFHQKKTFNIIERLPEHSLMSIQLLLSNINSYPFLQVQRASPEEDFTQ